MDILQFKILYQHLPYGSDKNHEKARLDSLCQAQISTVHLNTNQMRYSFRRFAQFCHYETKLTWWTNCNLNAKK